MAKMKKRVLSLAMALVMVFGLLPVTALADGSTVLSGAKSTAAYQYYDADGKVTTADGNWAVKMRKSAEATNDPTKFKINLEVEAKDSKQIITETKAVGADVVLVFDASTSMDDAMDGSTRWLQMKAAADTFITDFLAANENNRVSIVIYGGSNRSGLPTNHKTIQDWTKDADDAKDSYDYSYVKGDDGLRDEYFNDDETDYGATNCQAGFRGAAEQLKSATNPLKYVLYLSDGEANVFYGTETKSATPDKCTHTHCKANGTCRIDHQHCYTWQKISKNNWDWVLDCKHTHNYRCYSYTYNYELTGGIPTTNHLTKEYNRDWEVSYQKWNDADSKKMSADAAIAQLKKMTEDYDVTVYTIGFGSEAQSSAVLNSAYSSYRSAVDGDSLNTVYTDINTEIALASNPWTVTDYMGTYVNFDAASALGSYVQYDATAEKLTWDVAAEAKANGGKTFSYSYYVDLDGSNLDVWGRDEDGNYKANPTNGTTTLAFRITTTSDKGVEHTKYFTKDFVVPTVGADVYSVTLSHYLDNADTATKTETIRGFAGTTVELDSKIIATWPGSVTYTGRDSYNDTGAVFTLSDATTGAAIRYDYITGYAYTIRYVDESGSRIDAAQYPDSVTNGVAGTAISVTSPAIPGYHLKNVTDATVAPEGGMPVGGGTYNVVYLQDAYKVNYTFSGANPGNSYLPKDEETYHYGDDATVLDVTGRPEGWTFHGWKITETSYAAGDQVENLTGDVTLVGTWTQAQYTLDEIYRFASADDLANYQEKIAAAGNAAADALTKNEGESDEEFTARQDSVRMDAEYKANVLGEFHTSYEGMTDVYVKSQQTLPHGTAYTIAPVSVTDFKTSHTSGAQSGNLTEDTNVVYTLANDLFSVTVNHYQEVKAGTEGAIAKGDTYYKLVSADSAGSYNSNAPYTIAAKDYTASAYTLNATLSATPGEYTMDSADVSYDFYYDLARHTATFEFLTAGPSTVALPGQQTGLWHGIDAVTDPAITAPDGWRFSGWKTRSGEGTEAAPYVYTAYTFGAPLTADVTLYASWEAITYQAQFTFTGSVPTDAKNPATQSPIAYGGAVADPTVATWSADYDTAAQDYTFHGWYTDINCTAGSEYAFASAVTADVHLYGKWTVESQKYAYTVDYYVDGVKSFSATGVAAVAYGEEITAAAVEAVHKLDASDARFGDKAGKVHFTKATGIASISNDESANVARVDYKTNEYVLTINYEVLGSEPNKPQTPEQYKTTVAQGDEYERTSPTLAHYTAALLSNEDGASMEAMTVSGTMPNHSVTLTVQYTPYNRYAVVVNYYDIADKDSDTKTPLTGAFKTYDWDGESYDVTAAVTGKLINNYSYVSHEGDAITGTLDQDKVINAYFTHDTYTFVEQHVDVSKDNAQIPDTRKEQTLDVGTAYTTSALTSAQMPSGYKQVATPTVEGGTGKNQTVTVTYFYGPKDSVSLNVEYILVAAGVDGWVRVQDLDRTVMGLLENDAYDVTSDVNAWTAAHTQYTFVQSDPLTGNLSGTDSKTIQVLYTLNSYGFTVKYFDDYQNTEIAPREGLVVSGMAPFGATLNEELVTAALDTQDWIMAMRPSGYSLSRVAYVTITANAETNVVEVHYSYTPSYNPPDDPTPPTPPVVTPPVEEIPEEEVPLTDLPSEEIVDEEVPLAEAPATGDSMVLWIMAAGVSGVALVWVTLLGKKRRGESDAE